MGHLNRKELLRLAELADANAFIREAITPEGLELLARVRRPWYVRLWRWLKGIGK